MFSNASKGFAAPPESASHSGKSAFDGNAASRRGRDFHSTFFLEDGPMFDPCKVPGSRSLHERKLATWALLVGETHSSAVHAETRRRPHRGMLPDVDFSRAVPDYSRPSLVRRLFGLFRSGGGHRSADVACQESPDGPVGDMHSLSYIARERRGASADPSVPRESGTVRPLAA